MTASTLRGIISNIPAWRQWSAKLEAADPAAMLALKPRDGLLYLKDGPGLFGAEVLLSILDWNGSALLVRIDVGGPGRYGHCYWVSGSFLDWFRLYVLEEEIFRSRAL